MYFILIIYRYVRIDIILAPLLGRAALVIIQNETSQHVVKT